MPSSSAGITGAINATGVILHPALGRAPLSAAARQALLDASGYATVELDPCSGRHRARAEPVGALAAALFGAEAATVVNNGAAALVLTLSALAAGREVVISRGELVEFGRSYRLPELIGATPARLLEIGTSTHTRIGDYRNAVHRDTGALLKVHRPQHHLRGDIEEVGVAALAALAAQSGVPLIHHLGAGLPHDLGDVIDPSLDREPTVVDSLAAGADLVLVSGDKLLGGPQAGIIAGRADLVERCERHPLARALRIDKLHVAALSATLRSWLRTPTPLDLPVLAMLSTEPVALEQRATWLAGQLGDAATAAPTTSRVGGGLLSGVEVASWSVRLGSRDAPGLAARLLEREPAVVARVEDAEVVVDLRTVPPSRDEDLVAALQEALTAASTPP